MGRDQEELFYDSGRAALRSAIEHGKGYKPSAVALWPAMKPESAYAKLKACTKDGGDEKLELDEVVLLLRFNDRADVLFHLCQELSYAVPERRARKDEEARLVDVINGAADTLRKAMTVLERVRSTGAGR